jgi:hypothetical protein
MPHEERTRIWIDPFQTRLALRIGAYLALLPIVLMNLLFAWRLATEGVVDLPAQLLGVVRDYLPVGVCLLIVIPVMAWDAIRFSHRLVGPVVRFRQAFQAIAQGEAVRPVKLRGDDYLNELRMDFNRRLEALQRKGVPVLRPDVSGSDDEEPHKQLA